MEKLIILKCEHYKCGVCKRIDIDGVEEFIDGKNVVLYKKEKKGKTYEKYARCNLYFCNIIGVY